MNSFMKTYDAKIDGIPFICSGRRRQTRPRFPSSWNADWNLEKGIHSARSVSPVASVESSWLTCQHSLLSRFALLVVLAGTFGFGQDASPPPPATSPLEQADALLNEGRPREALALLTSLPTNDAKTPGLEERLGRAYFEERKFPEAIAHFKTALQQNATDAESAQFLALSLYGAGNFHEALPLLEKLGPRLPKDSPDSPYLLSICYVMTQQPEKARKSLSEIFSVPPDSAMAYLALGQLMVRGGMIDAAAAQIESALSLQPRLLMAHFLMGEIDLYQSKPQAAIGEFQKELALNPTLWLVYWRLGDAYVRVGNYDEAEKVLKEAVWLNDGSSSALVLLGEIAIKRNDPALGAGFLERGLALDPQNADAHEMLANAYKALGREVDANQQTEMSKKLRSEQHNSGKDPFMIVP
jgi:tetratricopeptide (TPR) repeat protein